MSEEKIKMSFDEYTSLCDQMANLTYKNVDYIPTISDLIELKSEPARKQLMFLMWLSESMPDAITDEEKEGKKAVEKRIEELIEFTD